MTWLVLRPTGPKERAAQGNVRGTGSSTWAEFREEGQEGRGRNLQGPGHAGPWHQARQRGLSEGTGEPWQDCERGTSRVSSGAVQRQTGRGRCRGTGPRESGQEDRARDRQAAEEGARMLPGVQPVTGQMARPPQIWSTREGDLVDWEVG